MSSAIAFRIWFSGHAAFIVLGAMGFGWGVVAVEAVGFFISLPALLLYALFAWMLRRLRTPNGWSAALFALFSLGITTLLIFYVTAGTDPDIDDLFNDRNRIVLRASAIAATALSLLLQLRSLVRTQEQPAGPASSVLDK